MAVPTCFLQPFMEKSLVQFASILKNMPLPPGKYAARIVSAQEPDTRKGVLLVTLSVLRPVEFAGRQLEDTLYLDSGSDAGKRICGDRLATLVEALGLDPATSGSADLVNRIIGCETRSVIKKETGKKYTNFCDYYKVEQGAGKPWH